MTLVKRLWLGWIVVNIVWIVGVVAAVFGIPIVNDAFVFALVLFGSAILTVFLPVSRGTLADCWKLEMIPFPLFFVIGVGMMIRSSTELEHYTGFILLVALVMAVLFLRESLRPPYARQTSNVSMANLIIFLMRFTRRCRSKKLKTPN